LRPFALWIILLIILPHMGMFYPVPAEKVAPRIYEFGFENYINFFTEPIYWNTLMRTGSMSLLVTALALLMGFPIAYYIAKIAGNRTRGALFLLCLIPLWVSDLIRAFGWILLLRETGIISSFPAVGRQ
jgi:spermidine/putrescine transport system permease protein